MELTFWGAASTSDNVGGLPYFRGGFVKGAQEGEGLERLETLLKSGEYDLIVLGGIDWNALSLSARYEILKRVE